MGILESLNYHKELEEICQEELPFEKLNHKTIFITGATGLIGSYLVDVFLKMNDILHLQIQVLAFCRSEEKFKERFSYYGNRKDLQVICGDVCKRINTALEWDYVIHCAGNNHPLAFATEPVETLKLSFMGTMNLLECCKLQKNRKIERFLLMSSGEIYGEQMNGKVDGCVESEPGVVQSLDVRACYPEGKRVAETLCRAYFQEYGVNIAIARMSYIYGATMQQSSSKADIQFIKKAIAKENIVMKSAGTQYRSYTYISDASIAVLYILLKGEVGEAYNVANPNSKVTIREFANQLALAADVKVEFANSIDVEQLGYSTMHKEILDSTKLYRLGFTAKVSIEHGLRKIVDELK